MWSYYGAKTNIVDCYPPPKFDKIIEPFAGTARYALKYFDREILLIDKYEVIPKIWKWLQQCSVNDILKLPILKSGEKLDDCHFDCEEAKYLIGFLVGYGMERPRRTASVKRTTIRPNHQKYSLKRIADNLFKIKHWTVIHGSYELADNESATWFIDPPYQYGGRHYPMNNNKLNFEDLGEWCKSREGQTIVCENGKAEWMDFKPLTSQDTRGVTRQEAIWSNMPTAFDNVQLSMELQS